MSLLRLFILCHLRSDAGFGGPGRVLEEGVVVVLLDKTNGSLGAADIHREDRHM